MSGSVNKAILVGNCTRDPEIRTMSNGNRLANLSVATNETWKDKTTGERKERAEYHRVVIFDDNLVSVVEQYLKKGSKVYLEGQLQTRRWTDQSGADRYSTEVVLQKFRSTLAMLDAPQQREKPTDWQAPDDPLTGGQAQDLDNQALGDDIDDSIPFVSPSDKPARRWF